MHKFSIINTAERPYLTWLKEGIKTAEGRINSPKYQSIKIGDKIMFINQKSGEFICGFVIFKHEYNTFEQMLISEGVKNMLPFLNDENLKEAIQVYEKFPGAERIKKFGCVAIGMKVTESKLDFFLKT